MNRSHPTTSLSSVLITGFGPFGQDTINPSGLIAEQLGGICLPVAADEAWERTKAEMARRGARFALALGVAGGRDRVCVEKWAFNETTYPIPDDGGRLLTGSCLADTAEERIETALPAAPLARAIRRHSIPTKVSSDAGRYVCNHFYYLLLSHLNQRAIFLHLPRLPEIAAQNGGGPSLSLADNTRAVVAALRFIERRTASFS